MADQSSYIPGMCNINKAEVAYRRKAMWFGVAVSAVILAACLALSVHAAVTVVLLFVPVYIAAIGFLQVRNRFCVSYGSKGQQNAEEGSAVAHSVEEASARAADKKKTRTMNLQALVMTLITLVACYGIVEFV